MNIFNELEENQTTKKKKNLVKKKKHSFQFQNADSIDNNPFISINLNFLIK